MYFYIKSCKLKLLNNKKKLIIKYFGNLKNLL